MVTGRLRAGVLATLPAILILVLLEIAARALFTVVADWRELRQMTAPGETEWQDFSRDLGWERRPGFSGDVYQAARSFDRDGYFTVDGVQLNDRSTPKIMLLGDSCTFGNGVAVANTYGEILERVVPGYAVINLAAPGYSSYQGVRVLEKHIGRVKPRIVISAFNFNDRRFVAGPDTADSSAWFAREYELHTRDAIAERLRYLYVYRLMKSALSAARARDTTGGEPALWVDTVRERVSPQDYRRNLARMVESARTHGAQMMFLTLLDNPPATLEMEEAIALLDQGKIEDAIAQFGERLDSGMYSTLWRRRVFEALTREGRTSRAGDFRRVEPKEAGLSLSGGEPIRTDLEYDAIMREVAREHGVPLIDGAAVLRMHPECFIDNNHFDRRGHALFAGIVADAVRAWEEERRGSATDAGLRAPTSSSGPRR